MNKYWFYLNSDVFLWKTRDKVLLYSTPTKKSLVFNNNNELNIVIEQLENTINLYCVELEESDLNCDPINSFIKITVDSKFGNIVKAIKGEKKPVFFVPFLKIQNSMEKSDRYVKTNTNMLGYLHEIDIYVNEGQNDCLNFSTGPTKTTNTPFADLFRFLRTFINSSSLNTINICGDNLLEYPSIGSLMDELSKTPITKIFHLKLGHLHENVNELLLLKSKPDQISIIVEPGFETDKIRSAIKIVESINISTAWIFKISSEQDYERAENIIDSHKIESYEILPFFNGSNHDFFEKFIYLSEEDIQNSQLTKREIFAHQVLNTNDFGRLTVKADGTVYANLYQPPLGTINDPVNEMLCKELSSNSSWLRIRDTAPCTDCIYRWLCPSPSNYELEMRKSNLCHIVT